MVSRTAARSVTGIRRWPLRVVVMGVGVRIYQRTRFVTSANRSGAAIGPRPYVPRRCQSCTIHPAGFTGADASPFVSVGAKMCLMSGLVMCDLQYFPLTQFHAADSDDFPEATGTLEVIR